MLGAHPEASNLAVVVEVTHEGRTHLAVYKPVDGERPLWDFPDGTLAGRERASYVIAQAGGWGCFPVTVLRDGPLGRGVVQQWIGSLEEVAPSPVVVTRPAEVPVGSIAILSGEDEAGAPLVVSHPDDPELRSMAVLDVVLNNSDRKGGHILCWQDRTYGIDHGVTLHSDPKLRTVLWGWADDPLPAQDRQHVAALAVALDEGGLPELSEHLTPAEVVALRERVQVLVDEGRHPLPSGDWPSVPWPPL